jgi:hypothetical protein
MNKMQDRDRMTLADGLSPSPEKDLDETIDDYSVPDEVR